jgi:DNA polymerase-3 subunit epsilon
MSVKMKNTIGSRLVVLDTETTGLNPMAGDRIVEIGLVELINRRPTGNFFQAYINPEQPVPAEAFAVHGLDNAFLADKPLFADVAQEFLDFIEGAELVIHNAPFDMGFLNMELAKAGLAPLEDAADKIFDSLAYSRRLGVAKRHSLDALCDKYSVNRKHRKSHGALMDAELLSEVYVKMTRTQVSLGMLSEDIEIAPGEATLENVATYEISVRNASDDEQAEHEAYLAQMEKENGGKNVWSTLDSQKRSLRI